MKTTASIEIERPIEEVFDFTTNHVAEWSLIVVEEEVLDARPEGVGTTFRLVTEDRGCRMEFDGEVIRHQPPTTQTVRMTGKQFDIEAEYVFEDLGERTLVTQTSTVAAKGLVKVMFFLFGWLMRKANCNALQQELQNLKQLLEAQNEETPPAPTAPAGE